MTRTGQKQRSSRSKTPPVSSVQVDERNFVGVSAKDEITYAEAEDLEIIYHSGGNSTLKLCQRNFETTPRQQTGCLSSLSTGMEVHVLEQCEQKVEMLPSQPRTVS